MRNLASVGSDNTALVCIDYSTLHLFALTTSRVSEIRIRQEIPATGYMILTT